MSEQENSTALGTAAAIAALPIPLPHSGFPIINSTLSDGGRVSLTWAHPGGRLHARISGAEGAVLASAVSNALVVTRPRYLLFIVEWSGGGLTVTINHKVVASDAPGATIVAPVIVADVEWPEDPGRERPAAHDFSAQNTKARVRRQGHIAGTHPRPRRKPGNKARDFKALKDEVDQLRDLIPCVHQGATHHALGIARSLRMLLIPNKGQLGLLQRCAARLDEDLIVYTLLQPHVFPPGNPSHFLRSTVSAESGGLTSNPVDVDVWLDLPAGRVQGQDFTYRDLLKAIGHTKAAHSDPDVHPIVEVLEAWQTSLSGQERDYLVATIVLLGEVFASVSDALHQKGA